MFFRKNSYLNILIPLILLLSSCQKSKNDKPVQNNDLQITPVSQVNTPEVKVGILNITSAASVNERYRPLLDYLEDDIFH